MNTKGDKRTNAEERAPMAAGLVLEQADVSASDDEEQENGNFQSKRRVSKPNYFKC